MPPRRSTRSSTRLSTEPDSNPQAPKQAPSSKRKRSTVDNTAPKDTNSLKPSTSRRGGRLSRSAVTVKAEPLDEPALESIDDVDDGEIEVPGTSQRKRSRKVKSLTPPQSVQKEDDADIGENATAIVPNGEVANVLAEESTPVPSPKKLPSNTPPVYEEKSLLDNLPTSPSKAKRPPVPLEDLQGPRPRLVIHKLVLVNFKSYAGCQEIGPFHRVGCFQCRNIKLISCSLSQRSSDLMVRASRILSTRYFLCSGTVPARCDKENSLN
jgi:structural maintenance of chromosome 4